MARGKFKLFGWAIVSLISTLLTSAIISSLYLDNNYVTTVDNNSIASQMTALAHCVKNYLFHFCRNSTPTITKNRAVTSSAASITGTESRHRNNMLRFLNQDEAIKVDEELFNEYKFSVDQLMELAGLSVASTIASVYTSKKDQKVLIICGPGNNGGDGMVAARHLKIFGFSNVTLLSARKPTKQLFTNLIHQAERSQVDVTYDAASFQSDSSLGLVVDALFGFSFKPPVRPDYQPLMSILTNAHSRKVPVLSVDIPSGWDVEKGPPEDESLNFMPDTLVSLTAPKLCAKFFNGPNHYLGGRFVPQELQEKYSLNLPPYPGIECIVRLL